jgi:hypothetical protein
MTESHISHIEPSRHSTAEVDQKLRDVERRIDAADGAGSPAIKPNTALGADGKPLVEAPAAAEASPAMQGEGNYDASRRFDKAEHAFVDAGKVADAAAAAAPKNAEEARDMAAAEREGLSHKKG